MIVLETARLRLRRFVPEDLEVLAPLYADSDIRRFFPDGTLTREETRSEIEWFLNGHPHDARLGLWATIHVATGAFVGRCGLLPWEIDGQAEVEVAYLLDRAWWGQGLATEAGQALVRYAFDTLGLRRVICLIDPGNHASRQVALRIGMGLERELDGVDGDGIPTHLFARHSHDRGNPSGDRPDA